MLLLLLLLLLLVLLLLPLLRLGFCLSFNNIAKRNVYTLAGDDPVNWLSVATECLKLYAKLIINKVLFCCFDTLCWMTGRASVFKKLAPAVCTDSS